MSSTLKTPTTKNMDTTNSSSSRTRAAHHDSLHNNKKRRSSTSNHRRHLDPKNDSVSLAIDLVTNYFLKQECDQSHVRIRLLQEQIERAKNAIHRGFCHKHYENDDENHEGEVRLRWSEGTEEYRQFQFEQHDKDQMMVQFTDEFLKQRAIILDELNYVEETRKHLQQAFNL